MPVLGAPVSSRLVRSINESGRSRVRSPPEAPDSESVPKVEVENVEVAVEVVEVTLVDEVVVAVVVVCFSVSFFSDCPALFVSEA